MSIFTPTFSNFREGKWGNTQIHVRIRVMIYMHNISRYVHICRYYQVNIMRNINHKVTIRFVYKYLKWHRSLSWKLFRFLVKYINFKVQNVYFTRSLVICRLAFFCILLAFSMAIVLKFNIHRYFNFSLAVWYWTSFITLSIITYFLCSYQILANFKCQFCLAAFRIFVPSEF